MREGPDELIRLSSAGHRRAVGFVSVRAAALRALTVDGRDLVESTADVDPPPGIAGATLAPWPNRVEGATWMLGDAEQHLEITEPDLGHANHGLLLDTDFDVITRDSSSVRLRTNVANQPGYPFELEVTVEYAVVHDGVTVQHTVRNLSSSAAPFAIGAHPYIRLGDELVEDLTLRIRSATALHLDHVHIPRGAFSVTGTPWDLRDGVVVAGAEAHAVYTDLAVEDGRVVHRLMNGSGETVELWADPAYAWVQVYVVPDFPSDRGPRTAIAVEPMTAPPNALRTGVGLRWLPVAAQWSASWGIRLR